MLANDFTFLDKAWDELRANGQDPDAVMRYVLNTLSLIKDTNARIAALSYFCIMIDNEIVKLKQAPGYEDLWKVS